MEEVTLEVEELLAQMMEHAAISLGARHSVAPFDLSLAIERIEILRPAVTNHLPVAIVAPLEPT